MATCLLVIGLTELVALGVWIHYRHQSAQEALRADRSYRYGQGVSPYSSTGDSLVSVRSACEKVLVDRDPFPSFSLDKAVSGCIAGWVAVMR